MTLLAVFGEINNDKNNNEMLHILLPELLIQRNIVTFLTSSLKTLKTLAALHGQIN